MTTRRWVVVALIGFAIFVAGRIVVKRIGPQTLFVDLVDQFPHAQDRRPNPDAFSVAEVSIGGVMKRAIVASDSTRIVFALTVPDNAELQVDFGVLEDTWTTAGEVLVRVMLAGLDSQGPDVVYSRELDPNVNPDDRRWHHAAIDLSGYAGETIEIFFNTNVEIPEPPPADGVARRTAWAPSVLTR